MTPLALAVALSFGLTAYIRRYALARQLLDYPNERSSHRVPTPRGGGLSIVITTTLGLIYLVRTHGVDIHLALAIGICGTAVATVGYIDDRRSLSVTARLAVHTGAAVLATWLVGGPDALRIGNYVVHLGIWGSIGATLALIWSLNLFNFMDGIDGIAGSQAVFVTAAAAFLAARFNLPNSATSVDLLVAAASFGFLLWNLPPARIFMGDVGSGYLGFVITLLALQESHHGQQGIYRWVILNGFFLIDATVTLLRRLHQGERIYSPHRSHAYQWLARKWNSHFRVTITVFVINAVWLFPCSYLAAREPEFAWIIAPVALLPLVLLVILVGAGSREPATLASRSAP